ncbi:uncharacterized protein Pyn_39264 [Prunus yedoensis var. nudiflora]|uniref:Uncharacterized protein n=1 Tax=Prunus yedoensis var. nudiflora TaxID=2094558 RepID=A0A314Y9E7_PRUYE|nr:uncharacterized protein Pyn_39264 [Prunus yedoensis var. nudiflora]
MLDQFMRWKRERFMRWRREEVKDVILERLSKECEVDFRLRRFIKLCSTSDLLLDNFIRDEAKDRDLESLHMQKSGEEEIEEIKQSRYAEFYLGLSIIWFKARWASDPKCLIHLIISKVGEGDHIIEKLVNETEEDFRLRRFTESFKQLQFSSQEDVLDHIQDILFYDPGSVQKESSRVTEEPVLDHIQDILFYGSVQKESSRVTEGPLFALEFMKVKTPNLRVSGGAAATQGGGQGAITQGG